MVSGIGTRFDGVGITNGGVATTKSRAKARNRKCRSKKRKGRNTVTPPPVSRPPVSSPPAVASGSGGFQIQGNRALQTSFDGTQVNSNFKLNNGETQNIVTDGDAGGFKLDVTGRQVTNDPNDVGINGIKINAGGTPIEICPCGDIKIYDAKGKVVQQVDLKDGVANDVINLPNGVRISTTVVNGKEVAQVENGEYSFSAAYTKTAQNCAQYDLKMREKSSGVSDNATPAPEFLRMDQIFG